MFFQYIQKLCSQYLTKIFEYVGCVERKMMKYIKNAEKQKSIHNGRQYVPDKSTKYYSCSLQKQLLT
jgi:hypothetical protein